MQSKKTILDIARECIEIERDTLNALTIHLEKPFEQCVQDLFSSGSRVVCCGIGKSALVAQKIVATLNSTGTSSVFLHAADAVHGDIGLLSPTDFLCCLSKSGETAEIRIILPIVKNMGCKIIAITANAQSYLAQQADYVLYTPIEREADPNNLAPTASTIAQMAMGDALAISLLHLRGFTPDDFAKFHPGGSLGKQLYLRVSDVYPQHGRPCNYVQDGLSTVILTMSKNRLGATVIIDEAEHPIGIITDGDLRRMLGKAYKLDGIAASDIMNGNPKSIPAESLAIEALELMRRLNINQLVVTQQNRYVGMIHIHDLIKEGLV
jgi:arabinose-5-phosphate isomerase